MSGHDEYGDEVVVIGGQLHTVCDVCNELRVPIIDGTAARFCDPCKRAGWR